MQDGLWNWQREDWPRFSYEAEPLRAHEERFLQGAGVQLGASMHMDAAGQAWLKVALLSDEAQKSSEIEGELLDRASLQSSIQRHLGLAVDRRKVPPAEAGMAQVSADLHSRFAQPLTRARLCDWQRHLMNGRLDLKDPGRYRRDPEPMQVVSGPVHRPTVHYQAPPAAAVPREMAAFLRSFNAGRRAGLPALQRAALAHHHFVMIHPFEDGNGRLARALADMALSQALGRPSLLALSHVLQARRKAYYQVLEACNRHNRIDAWMRFFAECALQAQARSLGLIEFLLAKAKFFQRHAGHLNERQSKALARVLAEGPGGFEGGLSAHKYISITGTTRATATRDLQALVARGALAQRGIGKGTRYDVNLL